jgi:hypothetical protein
MAAMGNILVKDDATSPVEYTLLPVTDTPNPFWRSAIAGVPFEGQIRLNLTSELLKDGSTKLTSKLEVPVMETLGASGTSSGYVAPPKVAYVNTYISTMFMNGRSTLGDRANLLKLANGIVQGASSTTATGSLDNTSAGDAWKSSSLPGPYFFIYNIVPN